MTCEQGLPGAAGVACLGRTGPQDQDHEVCVGDRVKRAYGFDFANAALGFIMPTLGPSSMSCRMNGARAQIPGSTHVHAGRPTVVCMPPPEVRRVRSFDECLLPVPKGMI